MYLKESVLIFKDLYLSYHHIEERKTVDALWFMFNVHSCDNICIYYKYAHTRVTNISLNEFVWSTNLQTNEPIESLTPTTSLFYTIVI